MSSISDQEMSECSQSPASYTSLESPLSSPGQLVPQQTAKLTSLSQDKNLYKSTKNKNIPFLRITEQPQNHFRFRYDTEKSGSTHGSLLGKTYVENKNNRKTHPSVELANYTGKAEIRCSIKYEVNKDIHKNIYKILEDEQNSKSYIVPKKNCYEVGFPGVGVHTIKKTVLGDLLYNKLSEVSKRSSVDTSDLRAHCDKMAKCIDQNIVRLRFSAHDVDTGKEICDPVLSDPILNKKSPATNALKICRMSLYSSRPSGGDELYLLVDKIDKNDIKVRFYEEDENGDRVWSAWGRFMPIDVHYQCAIVCWIPRYKDPETAVDVKVGVELVRPSNGSTSEPKEFVYRADPVYKQYKKRKIATPCSSSTSECNFSGESMNFDQPVMVLSNEPNEFSAQKQVTQPAQESTSVNEWSIISNTANILEDAFVQALQPQETTSPMWGPCHLISPHGGIAATQAPPCPAELSTAALPALPALPAVAEFCITVPPTQAFEANCGVVAPPALPSAGELSFALQPAQPLSSEQTTSGDVVIDDSILQYLEKDLTEYAALYDMSLDDLFQSDVESNLVGDSDRVKLTVSSNYRAAACISQVEPSTSSAQTSNAAGADAGSDDNVPHYQGARDTVHSMERREDTPNVRSEGASDLTFTAEGHIKWIRQNCEKVTAKDSAASKSEFCPEDVDDVTALKPYPQGGLPVAPGNDMRARITFLVSTGASDKAGSGATKAGDGARRSIGAEARQSAGLKTGADYAALFTAEDGAKVKKLVRELCEAIRDKSAARVVAAELERLFQIRLSNGDTFLHMTLFKNQRSFEALVKMVVSVKMSHLLNLGNNRGETILHLAVIHGTPQLCALLVAKGCEPAARNCEDETAVHYAVRYAGADTLRALLDAAHRAGAPLDLDAANAERQSALHLCALHERAACAALLGARGASGGVRDAAGRTPLHLCAYDARVGVARALLPHAAAHVHAQDGGGRTALAVACARGPDALELARALLAAGARAEPAWRAAQDHPALRDLLRPHLQDTDFDSEHEDDDDDDEYESADDEYSDAVTPETLACELGQMGLSEPESIKNHIR